MTYLYTFRIFVRVHTIFMHNVDINSDPYTLCNIWNFPCQVHRFISILYLTSFSVDSKVKSHVLHTFFNLTSYVYIFQHIRRLNDIFAHFLIFVHICTIFMNNVEFNSDTYTLYYILNVTMLSRQILVQSYTWLHFQLIVQLNVLFCTRL